MSADWTNAARALFHEHHINPDAARESGVREEDGYLVYPTGKKRSLNGAKPAHINPSGEQVRPWWVHRNERFTTVLVTEGETDGLAARTALGNQLAFSTGFHNLPILALPGCQYPPERLAKGLAHYSIRDAFLALDADEAGRKARDRIIRTLAHCGIRAIPVPLPDGRDLADYLVAGGDLANLLADAEADAPPLRTGPASFADIDDEPLRWLWRERIPTRTLTVIAGDPEQGKSLFTCALAAEVSRGGGNVLMANAEDTPARVRDRLRACGASLDGIYPVEGLSLPGGVTRLRDQVNELGISLITVDPYNAFLNQGISATRDQQVRAALLPLLDVARDFDCAVVIVCHLNRGGDEENPIYRIPVGLRGIARAVLTMKRAGEHTELVHTKSSYGPKQPAIHYTFDGQRLVGAGGEGTAGEMQPPVAASPSEPYTEAWDFTGGDE